MKHWLLLLITATAAQNSTRVVVTFHSASYNTESTVGLIPENITVVKQYGRRMVLDLGEESTDFIADALKGVERVESDSLVDTSGDFYNDDQTDGPVSAASESLPWHLDPLEPYGLRVDSILKNASTVVAILDSGLAAVAPWRPSGGYCFITSPDYTNTKLGRNPDYTDPGDQGPTCPVPSWHGTKVASIVKAIAPNCKLSILRVLGRCGTGFASDVTDAIVWAAGGGINGVGANPFPSRVVSMSLAGKGSCPTYMQSAVNQAIGMGATIIAAAGNAGANASLYFPGNCKGVLSIGASTRQGTLATYSNWGPTLAFSAPGGDAANPVQVLTVDSSGSIAVGYAMGTSFAAPHVAGATVLLQTIPWNQGTQYIPFAQCDAPVCGEILSHVGMSDTVQASAACTGSMSDQVWSIQAGFIHGGDSNPFFYCNAPCFVTRVIVCDKNGGMRSIQVQCSDGNYSPRYGYQGVCDGSTGGTADSTLGFTGITAYAGRDINGVAIWAISGAKSPYGCAVCENTYDMQCGFAPDNQKRVVTGIQIAHDSGYIHVMRLLCDARRCADGFYYANNNCIDCSTVPCGSNEYRSGCGGTSVGTCTTCALCLNTWYRSGCGGLSPGVCVQCAQCSGGLYFSKCNGGGKTDDRECKSCPIGTYKTAGYATDCKNCDAGTFTELLQTITCGACATCSAGSYVSVACTKSTNTQCAVCTTCSPTQYMTGCTGAIPSTCIDCGSCSTGSYRSGCSGTSSGGCTGCPAGFYCLGLNPSIATEWTVTTCVPGQYLYQVNTKFVDGKCDPCPANNYCAGGTAANIACPAGSYCSTDGSSKTTCPQGSYCAEGVTTFTGCSAGYYSTASGASSVSTCQQCEAGKKAATTGSSACALCLEGTSSAAGAVSCTDCFAGSYQNQQGQSGCKPCNTVQCAAGTVAQPCTAKTDKTCSTCNSIANCRYREATCTNPVTGKPTCACAAGYQMVDSLCEQCPYGMFKAEESTNPCAPWKTPACTSFSLGTRVKDSECVEFPPPPDNAVVEGGAWKCNAGYEVYK
jgi:hypothetical protein